MALACDRLDPSAHDQVSFSCGDASFDNYLKRQATQDMRSRVAVCYVLHEQGSPAIISYYTLSAIAIEPRQVPAGADQTPSPVSAVVCCLTTIRTAGGDN